MSARGLGIAPVINFAHGVLPPPARALTRAPPPIFPTAQREFWALPGGVHRDNWSAWEAGDKVRALHRARRRAAAAEPALWRMAPPLSTGGSGASLRAAPAPNRLPCFRAPFAGIAFATAAQELEASGRAALAPWSLSGAIQWADTTWARFRQQVWV